MRMSSVSWSLTFVLMLYTHGCCLPTLPPGFRGTARCGLSCVNENTGLCDPDVVACPEPRQHGDKKSTMVRDAPATTSPSQLSLKIGSYTTKSRTKYVLLFSEKSWG